MSEYTSRPVSSLDKVPEKKKEAVKVEKIATNPVKVKKKTLQKFASIFIASDVADVKSHIINNVVIPTIKNTIADSICMLLGVERRGSLGGSKSRISEKYSYNSYYDRPYGSERTVAHPQAHDYDELIFETKGEAIDVLETMQDLIRMYGAASILQYFDAAGLENITKSSDNDYGWRNLEGVRAVPSDGGYKLTMPRALPLG